MGDEMKDLDNDILLNLTEPQRDTKHIRILQFDTLNDFSLKLTEW